MNKLFLFLLFLMPPTFSSTMGASHRRHRKQINFKPTAKELNKEFAQQERELNEYLRAMNYKASMRNKFGLEKGKIPTIKIDVYHV